MDTVDAIDLHACPECGSCYVEFVTRSAVECSDCGCRYDDAGETLLVASVFWLP